MSLYEKLNELDFELTEKEKELEEFKATSLDFELSLDEPEEEPSLSSKGHVQKKKDFQRELKKTKKKKADKKSKEVTQQGGRNGMSKLAYERQCTPETLLTPISQAFSGDFLSPQMKFNFNRGLSSSSTRVPGGTPVSVAVMSDVTQEAFQIAQLTLTSESEEAIRLAKSATGKPIQNIQYTGQNLTNQRTTSMTTAVVNLVEYELNPNTNLYQPIEEERSSIYSLIGIESGEVNLCEVFVGDQVGTTTSCSFKVENLGYAIADMLYIPQKNFVIMLTVKSVMVCYTVNWNDGVPSLSYFGQLNDLPECYEGSSESSEDKEAGCAEIPSPRSMSAMFVDNDNTFIYLCVPNGLFVYNLQETNSDTPLAQQGSSWIGTDFCVQSVPTPYGIYLNTQSRVLFMPFEQFNPQEDPIPPYGMLGNENPGVWVAYEGFVETSSAGIKSDDSNEYTYDLITSIAFSLNTNNVVQSRNPINGEDQSFFVGGALFISTVKYSNVVLNTDDCLKGNFGSDSNTPSYSETCPGSMVLHDTCSGTNSPYLNDIIDGPVYGMNVDNNMNVVTQNGEGGVSFFSVAYTPGAAQSGVFLQNKANPCASKLKDIIEDILAAVSIAIGFITGVDEILAGIGMACSLVGFAMTLPPIPIPSAPYPDCEGYADYYPECSQDQGSS